MTKDERTDRNLRICQFYRDGSTLDELANRFSLNKQRVWQILHDYGLNKHDRKKSPPSEKVMTAVMLTPDLKEELRLKAVELKTSITAVAEEAIEMYLHNEGV